MCIIECYNLSIINHHNNYVGLLLAVKEIFLEANHGYYMIHFSKNLMIDIRDRDATRHFGLLLKSLLCISLINT